MSCGGTPDLHPFPKKFGYQVGSRTVKNRNIKIVNKEKLKIQ